MKVELVSRVVRQRGLAQAFVSLPRLRETRPCCPNSASICLWSGLDPELPSGAEGSQRRSDYRKNLHSV